MYIMFNWPRTILDNNKWINNIIVFLLRLLLLRFFFSFLFFVFSIVSFNCSNINVYRICIFGVCVHILIYFMLIGIGKKAFCEHPNIRITEKQQRNKQAKYLCEQANFELRVQKWTKLELLISQISSCSM